MQDAIGMRMERETGLALLRQLLEDDPVIAREVWLRVVQRTQGGDLFRVLAREAAGCLQRGSGEFE